MITGSIRGTLQRRYKRFIADVLLENQHLVQAHCPNTGPMTGLLGQDSPVILSHHKNPKRKMPYTWELVQMPSGDWVGVNTHRPNQLFREAFDHQKMDFFKEYTSLVSEVSCGESRLDFMLSKPCGRSCYVEVKNAHMKRGEGVFFPDAVTARGTKHVKTLTQMAEQGQNVALVYVIQRSDCAFLSVAADVDPVYAKAFRHAQEKGVKFLAYACSVTPHDISIETPIEIRA
jgi:sugar fermentation stimulation protein A